jgi:hypothetical protein
MQRCLLVASSEPKSDPLGEEVGVEETRKAWRRVHRMATAYQRWEQAEAIRVSVPSTNWKWSMYRTHVFFGLVYVTWETYDEGKIGSRSTKIDEIATEDFVHRLRRFRNHWFHDQRDMFNDKYLQFFEPEIDGPQKTVDLHFALQEHFNHLLEWEKIRTQVAHEAEGVSLETLEKICDEQYDALPQWFKDRHRTFPKKDG